MQVLYKKITFETSITYLKEALLYGEHEQLKSPSSRLVTGQYTNCSDVKFLKFQIYGRTTLANWSITIDTNYLVNIHFDSRYDVGSHLSFVDFDCETFMNLTQRRFNSQIISIMQVASLLSIRYQSLYGIFDMLALRLQFNIKSLADFAQQLFSSRDFILLKYNYAGDTSFFIENYPSINDALMQGTAIIDLFYCTTISNNDRLKNNILTYINKFIETFVENGDMKIHLQNEFYRICASDDYLREILSSNFTS
ncbi:unnamed protein product [Rotaria sordida]|uniref:Uncharacterized protein n=2 Tax=Rotaria sordida TaxID=392033 RepID=A0A815BHF5_9BILA|nr:unnamed protein product [Rotaria sordida]CAF1551038.1 unnamed protein product [Rotaria sordida]CAF3977902.1 unnamed protein product [Rotaria sordida]